MIEGGVVRMTPQKLTTTAPLETSSFSPTLVVTPSPIVATLKSNYL
jgi:hypothetical protein